MHFRFYTNVSADGTPDRRDRRSMRAVIWFMGGLYAIWCLSCAGTRVSQSSENPAQRGGVVVEDGRRSFRVMSFNVLHPTQKDTDVGRGWSVRRDLVVKQIIAHKPDILLLQEVVFGDSMHTAAWLREQLAGKNSVVPYAVVAGAGEEPKDILVNTQVFEVLFPFKQDSPQAYSVYGAGILQTDDNAGDNIDDNNAATLNSFFLPPDSTTICASELNREEPLENRKTASFALLRHRATQKQLAVANVHLLWQLDWREAAPIDNELRVAQLQCVSDVLHERFAQTPKLIAGDFNAELGSEEIARFMNGFGNPSHAFKSTHLLGDSPQGTWTGFCEDCTPTRKIDHIFVQNVHVLKPSRALPEKFNDQWPSDHCPVLGEFEL